ncbi:hypothetical protein [Rhodococcus sp. 11-3]|uniref:hypothetical protein n=1 Tax=Rhodococcus sp. 11-3 TaxID=2854796 RepID=UPI00203B2C59|nr:hypothetical protein [Rhodococcus sp. 11-3]USC17017.1 hypothetical protein KZJ41_09190 [Rhodococcus sp. 11-3]
MKAESLCRVCVARLDEWLERAGWLEGQLELNVTRQSQSGSRYREGGRSTEKPLVFDDKASEAAWVLEHTLTGLARRCVDTWGMCPSDPRRLVPWLRSRLFEVARLDDIGDVMGELQSAVDLGLATIERPEPRVYIGDCRCGRPVYGQGGDEAECRCGEIFRVAESRVANREAGADLLLTAREAALYAGELHGVQITAKRIRVWASRGKIQGRGQDRQGENVYRLGEILRVAAEKFLGSDASGP